MKGFWHATRAVLPAFIMFGSLTACLNIPTTANDFRNYGPIVNSSTFVVSKSASSVRASLSRFAAVCLDGKSVRTVEHGAGHFGVYTDSYTAGIIKENGITSLLVKLDQRATNMVYLDPAQKGPQYFVLADIIPVGSGQTRLNIRSVKITGNKIVRGIKGWAAGTSRSCPDLTKTF